MFAFFTESGLWKWFVRGLRPWAVCFTSSFWHAFLDSQNFIVFVGSVVLFLYGVFTGEKAFKGVSVFGGILFAVLSLGEFLLRY